MELICPSCEARYQLPAGSVGEKGRQVSCMNCGNSWHAYPPLVLGSEGAPSPAQSTGLNWAGPDGVGAPTAPTPPPRQAPAPESQQPSFQQERTDEPQLYEPAPEAPVAGGAAAGESSRTEQLAEIRKMLAEVQSEDRAAAAVSSGAAGEALRRTSTQADVREVHTDDRQRQKIAEERMAAQQDQQTRALARQDASDEDDDLRRRIERKHEAKPTDVRRIRRAHDRKVRKDKRAKAAGSGAFLTGFLLIAIIAAVMIALYVLHPQIIQKMPGTEGPLTEYVATIDSLRLRTAETFAGITDWVSEQLEEKT
ncbi:MAG: zinc-ribbon domain-containing protein [Pseudomonadota bacterium]